MNINWAIVIGLIQILFTGFSRSVIINGSQLRSFTCLGMNATTENCRVLGTVAAMPERLLNIYRSQKMKIQVALDTGDLNILKEHELATLHPDLLLLIPSAELAHIGGEKLAFLVDHWSDDKAVIRHILSAALLKNNINQFLQRVQTIPLGRDALEIMGENLSLDQNLKLLGPLLAHLPLSQISNITSDKRLKVLVFLKLYINNEDYKWSEKRPITHRVWAKLLLEEEFPKPLNKWNNFDIQTIGEILIGAKPSELCQIDGRNPIDKNQLFNLGFSTLQVRALVTKLYKDTDFTTLDFHDLKPILVRLLPTQLQRFSSKITYFKSIQISPLVKSVATSKQIIEFLLREGKHRIPQIINSSKDNILQIGRMVHSLPLSALSVYRNNPLSLDQLLPLQSKYLTSTQVYYLLGMGTELNISSPKFKELNVYLHALPTSQLPKKLSRSQVTHLSLHLSTDNLPRLMKFLYHALPTIGSTEVMKALLQNPDRLKMLEYLPTRLLMIELDKVSDMMKKLSSEFHSAWSSLPKKMASSLYRSLNESLSNSVIDTESIADSLTHGFNCQDISKLFTSDFIPAISRYRRLIEISNQEFPKELQLCTTRKLVEYLKLKSFFRQQYVGDTLVSLLSPVEIEAVGGWVLSNLPLQEIIASTYIKDIVRQIGSMSATEILAAAPLGKMRAIVYNYLALQKPLKKMNIEELSVLGNLTMIIEENVIQNIDESSIKELLEGSYFDTRICSSLSSRNAWRDLLLLAFGPTKYWSGEVLTIIGNLLIVIPEENIRAIPTDAWIQVADILEFGYFKRVQWYKKNTFFEVCQKILMPLETESYVSSIKTVLTFYLRAAQFQLNTVKKLEQLRPVYDLNKKLEMNDEELTTIKIPNESSYLEVNTENYEASPSTLLYQAESNKTSNISTLLDANHSQNISTILKDIANSTDTKEQNDPTFNSNENTSDLDGIEVIPVERSHRNYEPKAAEMATDSQPKETHYFRSEEDDMPELRDIFTDESSEEPYNDESKPQISLPAESDLDSIMSLPSKSTYFKLKDDIDNLTNTTENNTTESTEKIVGSQDFSPALELELVTTDNPISLTETTDENADDQNKIAPDLFTALTEIEKESQSPNNVEKLQESDEILQPIMEQVSDSDTCIHTSECNTRKTVIQPLKIPLEMPAPAKVRLQDVFPRSKEALKIYRNITEALNALTDDEDEDHKISQEVVDHDDILHPVVNSDDSETRKIEKRSIKMEEVSCEAIKTVGEEIRLILSEDIIQGMSNKELFDCTELFASMKLPETIRQIIWSRLDKAEAHLKGTLVSEAERKDLEQYNFTSSNPWALETIFTLANFNENPSVLKYILDQEFQHKEVLTIEEVVSLGKIICNLPNLKDVLSPSVFLRSSVILGSTLPCNYTCLNTFIYIASSKEAFGPVTQWTSFDIADLGIIVAGLNKQNWKELIEINPDILYGLQATASECLEPSYIEEIPVIHIPKIPYFTRIAIYEKLESTSRPQKLQKAFSDYEEISLRENTTESSHSSIKYFNNYLKFIVTISNIIFYNYFNFYFSLH